MNRLLVTIFAALLIPVSASAAVLLQDDFNDNSLDATKWDTVLPFANSSVVEQNQRIEITNRGYLVTAEEYDPFTSGGLRITGTWTFNQEGDFLQILTRSDATPSGSFGETQNGVEFYAYPSSNQMGITYRGTAVVVPVSTAITIDAGDVFNFEITDDGTNLTFTLTEVGGSGATATLATTGTVDMPTDFIVFHNREFAGGINHIAYLDNVVIEQLAEADLAVTKTDSPDPVAAGEQLTYTINVDNLGTAEATTIEITDVIPAGTTFVSATGEASACTFDAVATEVTCTLATLAAGGNETITLIVAVDADVASGTVLSNTAALTTETLQTDMTNDADTETTAVAAEADLTITKTGGTDVNAGGQTQYEITVTNQGPSDAQDVVMEDVLPAGTTFVSITEPAGFDCVTPAAGATGTVTCTAVTLAAGDTAQFTLTVAVDPNLPSGTTIENTATVTSTTTDPTPANNTGTVTARAAVPGIPTMSEWGLLAMIMALAAFGALRLRS